jgi:hypothetical protein
VERAARAQGTRALIDPKVLSVAMQAGTDETITQLAENQVNQHAQAA